jgi:hypothetical protein
MTREYGPFLANVALKHFGKKNFPAIFSVNRRSNWIRRRLIQNIVGAKSFRRLDIWPNIEHTFNLRLFVPPPPFNLKLKPLPN